jgi:hypothetical protein
VREEETALKVLVELQGERLECTLDSNTRKWTPVEPATNELLQEGEFPLVAFTDGKRYELYSDGSFDEVEL